MTVLNLIRSYKILFWGVGKLPLQKVPEIFGKFITGDFGVHLGIVFFGLPWYRKDFFADHATHVIWRHDRCRPSEHGVPGENLLLGFLGGWAPMTCKWLLTIPRDPGSPSENGNGT